MEHLNTLKAFCDVLGLSFEETTRDLHRDLHHDEGYMSISDDSVESLVSAIDHLRKVKLERMQKVHLSHCISFRCQYFVTELQHVLWCIASRSCQCHVGVVESNGYPE